MKRILATYIVLSILTSRTAHSVEPEYADRALIIRSPELLDAPEFAGTSCDGGTQGRSASHPCSASGLARTEPDR